MRSGGRRFTGPAVFRWFAGGMALIAGLAGSPAVCAGVAERLDDAVQNANRSLQPAILLAVQPAQLLADFLASRAEVAGEKSPDRLEGAEGKAYQDLKAGAESLATVAPDKVAEIAALEARFEASLESVQSVKGNPPVVLAFTPRVVYPDEPMLKIEIVGRNLSPSNDPKLPKPALVFEQRGKAEAKFAGEPEPGRLLFSLPRKALDDPARAVASEPATLTIYSKSCPWWKLKLSCDPREHRFTLWFVVVPETIAAYRVVEKVQPKELNEREYDVPLAGCATSAISRDLGAPWTKKCEPKVIVPADPAWKFDLSRTGPKIATAQLKCQGRDPPAGIRRGNIAPPEMGATWSESKLEIWMFVESDGKFPCSIAGAIHVTERRREPVSEDRELAKGPLSWNTPVAIKLAEGAGPATLAVKYFNGREALYPEAKRDAWLDVKFEADPVKRGLVVTPAGRPQPGGAALAPPAFP